jgi:hypothetical protein
MRSTIFAMMALSGLAGAFGSGLMRIPVTRQRLPQRRELPTVGAKSHVHNISLADYQDLQYYGEIQVGTGKPQTLTVTFATETSGEWIKWCSEPQHYVDHRLDTLMACGKAIEPVQSLGVRLSRVMLQGRLRWEVSEPDRTSFVFQGAKILGIHIPAVSDAIS